MPSSPSWTRRGKQRKPHRQRCRSLRPHPTFRERHHGLSRAHSRIKVARGGAGAVAASGGRPQCRRIGNCVSTSHPDGFGGPSADFAADGHPITGRAGCLDQGSPGWPRNSPKLQAAWCTNAFKAYHQPVWVSWIPSRTPRTSSEQFVEKGGSWLQPQSVPPHPCRQRT